MTRILPREEWDRLDADVRALYDTMSPEDVAVVVAERDGEILARLAVLRVPHFESVWLAPEAQGNAGITRALLRAATAKACEWAPNWIYANSDNDTTSETLKRLGGTWLPMHTFMLGLHREESCRTYQP